MLKVGLVSLGCAKNLVDSENILGLIKHDGYQITSSIKDSDIIIVNTCGFIDSSKKESIETIFEMLSYNKKVVVTGCLAQRYEKELKEEIPEATFIPIHDYDKFNELFRQVDNELKASGGLDDKYRVISTGSYSAYLTQHSKNLPMGQSACTPSSRSEYKSGYYERYEPRSR